MFEASYYSDRELAALAWSEAVTNIQDGHVPDAVYERARRSVREKELADLTLVIVAINGWNRTSPRDAGRKLSTREKLKRVR